MPPSLPPKVGHALVQQMTSSKVHGNMREWFAKQQVHAGVWPLVRVK